MSWYFLHEKIVFFNVLTYRMIDVLKSFDLKTLKSLDRLINFFRQKSRAQQPSTDLTLGPRSHVAKAAFGKQASHRRVCLLNIARAQKRDCQRGLGSSSPPSPYFPPAWPNRTSLESFAGREIALLAANVRHQLFCWQLLENKVILGWKMWALVGSFGERL